MEGYTEATYGDGFADVYDEWYRAFGAGGSDDATAAVDALARLARRGPVLELGVGTGRLAIPLARRGLEVWGVDASPAMLDRLRAKPGGEQVRVVRADMAECPLIGAPPFALTFAAANTLFNLVDRDRQRRCLARAGELAAPGGRLVVEAFVPGDGARQAGGDVAVRLVELDRVVLTISACEPMEQVVRGQHVEITESGVRLRPWVVRFAWPDELDALAAEAGWTLATRAAGWRAEPFTHGSPVHVSVYERG
jgi:SAM-dependent methyltransferase